MPVNPNAASVTKKPAFGVTEHAGVHFAVHEMDNSLAYPSDAQIVSKMQRLEQQLAARTIITVVNATSHHGRLHMNGPLPVHFDYLFAKAVAFAVSCNASDVKIVSADKMDGERTVVVDFEAPLDIVQKVERQAADPYSRLTNGPLRPFLVSGGNTDTVWTGVDLISTGSAMKSADVEPEQGAEQEHSIDVDTAMPYGELEPFGREDTALELTERSISESDEMVDQLERAEVAEEKRAVFRALTRLRGAAIASTDGIARSQTGNIDEYNKVHKWRSTHPLRHLASEEADVSKWAFPDSADF